MKILLIPVLFILMHTSLYAQETIPVDQKITNKLSAVYFILKSDHNIKHGLYQVRHSKSMALVSGMYTNNQKTGTWHYFDYKGNLVQNFNFDTKQLTYLAPDQITSVKYYFDKDLKDSDKITKPIRIGGWDYGYMPYLDLFKKPSDLANIPNQELNVSMELLITPYGRLADYSIHISSESYQFNRTLTVNLNLLSDEDKIFVAATYNGEPTSSRIMVRCHIDGKKLVFD